MKNKRGNPRTKKKVKAILILSVKKAGQMGKKPIKKD